MSVASPELVREFHDLYWTSDTWRWTFWRGIPTLKCPLDLWIYQELLWHLRPQLVIELGTFAGGTTNFLADMLDLNGAPPESGVLTVDILDRDEIAPYLGGYDAASFPVRIRPPHPRIDYLTGDSISAAVVAKAQAAALGKEPVMVIADSNHSLGHTRSELSLYADLVTPGSWFVMEDTDGPEPRDAVAQFLLADERFAVDPQCEKFHLTFNPGGYLLRRM